MSAPTEKTVDREGWPISVGSYVRVERPGVKSFRGWVREVGAVLRLEDDKGKDRQATAAEVVVVRPSSRAKARRGIVQAGMGFLDALGKRRKR